MRREASAWIFALALGVGLWSIADYVTFGKGWMFIEVWKELLAP